MNDSPRTLVYHAGALGDFVTALPAIQLLADQGPVELWGKPEHAALAGEAVSHCRDVGGPELAAWFGAKVDSPERDAVASIQRAFLFAAAGSPVATALKRAGVASVMAHPPRPAAPTPIVAYHEAAAHAFLTGHTTGGGEGGIAQGRRGAQRWLLEVPDSWQIAATQLAPMHWETDRSRTVVIAPGSGGAQKVWPLSRFRTLADELGAAGWAVVWLLGPAETEQPGPPALPARDRVWEGLDLTVLAALLADVALYVGNDSGTTHLAAAIGAATVALFGPSDPRVWSPAGRRVRVLTAGAHGTSTAMEQLPVGQVVDACLAALEPRCWENRSQQS